MTTPPRPNAPVNPLKKWINQWGKVASDDPATQRDRLNAAIAVVQSCVSESATTLEPAKALLNYLLAQGARAYLSDDERNILTRTLIEGLFDTVADLPGLAVRDVEFVSTLLGLLTDPSVSWMAGPDRRRRVRRLIEEIFSSRVLADFVGPQPVFFCSLVTAAVQIARDEGLAPDYVTRLLGQPSGIQPAMACAVVQILWKSTAAELGPEIMAWLFDGDIITVQTWNDRDQQLAARGFNLLWVSGDYDRICVLIKKGVDCTLSAEAWDGTKREGVWTGYVQPLTHVLGKYVKQVELLGPADQGRLRDLARVRGAKQIIGVLSGLPRPPKILLSYPAIQSCQLIAMFKSTPGTIWGFEDVRLPYVQAARETAHGQQPLRMLDMWEAIGLAIDAAVYPKLISGPAPVIKECVKKAVQQVRKGIQEKGEHYEGMIEEPYIKAFEKQCTSYLTFLANRLPYIKFMEPAQLTGKNSGKLMPTFACKTGIWWAKSQDCPLYYCIDGLNMQDVINYKALKTKAINAYLGTLGTSAANILSYRPFQEVVTLAEVREILLNWDDLWRTVRIVEMGNILDTKDAERWARGWIVQMREVDRAAPRREWAGELDIRGAAFDLYDDAVWWAAVPLDEIRACVREAALLKRMMAREPAMLRLTLNEGCATLRRYSLVPAGFIDLFNAVIDAPESAKPPLLGQVRDALPMVCQGLRQLLTGAIDGYFGPAPATGPAISTADIDLAFATSASPTPDTGTGGDPH